MSLRYLVAAPPYDPNSGGSIFLHELVHALRLVGADAALWPMDRKPMTGWRRLRAIWRRPALLWAPPPPFAVAPDRDTPVAPLLEAPGRSVVIYPEVLLGNPFGARRVVRWLLYRPGLLHPYDFGPDEMFFRAGEMSDLPELTGGAPDLFVWKIDPAYRNEARPDRKGACYLLRKGAAKPRIPETEGAIPIDGLSHAEIAEIFNRCETFYSYDEASFYSQYAAICGCLSVVVPGLYGARAEWVAQHPLGAMGVAYGLDDLDHARQTRHKVIDLLQARQEAGLQTVRNFVALTEARFGG